ncbi:MAG: hypothetical protein ACXVDV_18640 [Bacteroidia bacterium]
MYGQDKPRKNYGIGIEIGVGYNNLIYKYDDKTALNIDTKSNRNAFSIQPSVRVYYVIPGKNVGVSAFLGYYNFGGNSQKMSNGYKDSYLFRSSEFGIIPHFKVKDILRIGIGFKGQYIFNVEHKYYGYANDPNTIPRKWMTANESASFAKLSLNAGLNIKYIYKHFSVSLEGWLGISNLNAIYIDQNIGVLKVRENNYRFLIGYEF